MLYIHHLFYFNYVFSRTYRYHSINILDYIACMSETAYLDPVSILYADCMKQNVTQKYITKNQRGI